MSKTADNLKRFAITIIAITICYSSSALMAFANIGQGPVGAFQLTMSYFTNISMGIIAICFQGVFFIGQIVLEGKRWKIRQCLQMLITVYGGLVLDFVLYHILSFVNIETYLTKIFIFIIAMLLNAVGINFVLGVGLIRIPYEGFLQLLSERINISLGRWKQVADFILLGVTVYITIRCHYDFTVREATVANAFFFGLFLDWTREPICRILQIVLKKELSY